MSAPVDREKVIDLDAIRASHRHSWRFDGDDPYVLCECGERRDAISGRVITPGRFSAPSPTDEEKK